MTNLLVITVNTKTHELGFKNFEQSCKIFGYDYYILAKEEDFRDFQWRTYKYIEGIEQISRDENDVILICDSNDVFFIGPAEELLQKFKAMNKRIVVGAESACCNGKNCSF
jgi:hypothetical protein